MVRVNQAGDLQHDAGQIDHAKALQLAAALTGKTAWTYTHHTTATAHNRATVAAMNRAGLAVSLSANTAAEADALAALQIAPVVMIAPTATPDRTTTPAGRPVMACPASAGKSTCGQCRLCAKPDRAVIVAFPAHGTRRKTVEAICTAAP